MENILVYLKIGLKVAPKSGDSQARSLNVEPNVEIDKIEDETLKEELKKFLKKVKPKRGREQWKKDEALYFNSVKRKNSRKFHPDKGGTKEQFQKYQEVAELIYYKYTLAKAGATNINDLHKPEKGTSSPLLKWLRNKSKESTEETNFEIFTALILYKTVLNCTSWRQRLLP